MCVVRCLCRIVLGQLETVGVSICVVVEYTDGDVGHMRQPVKNVGRPEGIDVALCDRVVVRAELSIVQAQGE